MFKDMYYRIALCLSLILLLSACRSIQSESEDIVIIDSHSFMDSLGNEVVIDKPFTKIVSLYSAHTENLYAMGGGDYLIGVNTTSTYPPQAVNLVQLDYRKDPEEVIALEPDLIISRPYIDRNYHDYIKTIEKAGIQVVSLYPDAQDDFDDYIRALSMLIGKEAEAEKQLEVYEAQLENIRNMTAWVEEEDKVHVFFEATQEGYKTVTPDSGPAIAIEIAGGINIAKEAKALTKGSTIAEFGIEKLMMSGDDIDVYVSQRGAMNAGGSMLSISQREGFDAIKAVANNQILEINQKLISSPSFRYPKGVLELARMFYPDLMDDISIYNQDKDLTREAYADLLVKLMHTPIFVPSSSLYYEQSHRVHTYGQLKDVSWQDPMFDVIETALMSSYIPAYHDEDGIEYFDPQALVRKEDLAYTLYMLLDIHGWDQEEVVYDLDECKDPIIVQKIVDAGYLSINDEHYFNPKEVMSGAEVIEIIRRGLDENKYEKNNP
jgi:iron complex transport system substrate-binding protein